MKTQLIVHTCLTLLLMPLAQAADEHAGHAMMHSGHAQAMPLTPGVVKFVDLKAGEVVIQHGPVESLGMPAMTMGFGVTNKAWLTTLKAGDRIRFTAEMGNNGPIVNRLERAK